MEFSFFSILHPVFSSSFLCSFCLFLLSGPLFASPPSTIYQVSRNLPIWFPSPGRELIAVIPTPPAPVFFFPTCDLSPFTYAHHRGSTSNFFGPDRTWELPKCFPPTSPPILYSPPEGIPPFPTRAQTLSLDQPRCSLGMLIFR